MNFSYVLYIRYALLQIAILMSHPNRAIAGEVLAFLAAMLYSGNETIQVWNFKK